MRIVVVLQTDFQKDDVGEKMGALLSLLNTLEVESKKLAIQMPSGDDSVLKIDVLDSREVDGGSVESFKSLVRFGGAVHERCVEFTAPDGYRDPYFSVDGRKVTSGEVFSEVFGTVLEKF
ncbi:MAG: hypothetical protein AAB672_00580 [Patescibacteria group bacterium]